MRISDWSSDVCSSDLAHGVTGQLARVEATLEKAAPDIAWVAERRDAAPQVADPRHVPGGPQTAGRAAVVSGRDDRGHVLCPGRAGAQRHREAVTPTEGHDPRRGHGRPTGRRRAAARLNTGRAHV